MFLRVTRTPRQTWHLDNTDTQINGHRESITSVNPSTGLALLGLPPVLVPRYRGGVAPHRTLTPAIMNPMLLRSLTFNDRERKPDSWSENHCDCIVLTPNHCILRGPNGPKPEDMLNNFQDYWSLLDTYLTNPPCRQAWIAYMALRLPPRISRSRFSGLLEVETGITMRHVLNAPSVVRGVAEYQRLVRTDWQPWASHRSDANVRELPAEVHDNVILEEVLESLHAEDGELIDLHGNLCCAFLDTIIPTDRMRAGVVPYAENVATPDVEAGGESKDLGDEGRASSSDEEIEDLSGYEGWASSSDEEMEGSSAEEGMD